MEKVMMHTIPSFFSAYCLPLDEGSYMVDLDKGTRILKVQYHCQRCGQDFTIFHRYIQRLGYYGYGDEVIGCPNCGEAHRSYRRQHNIFRFTRKTCGPTDIYVDPEDFTNELVDAANNTADVAPTSTTLTLTRVKDGFVLRVFGQVISMVPDDEEKLALVHRENRTEEFRFDVKHRRTMFSIIQPVRSKAGGQSRILKSYELGDPLDRRIYKDSLLVHLRSENLSCQYLKGTKQILKALRDGIRKKWKEIHSYDIGTLFVPAGTTHGSMLFPIINLAFRMVYQDTGNLLKELNSTDTEVGVFVSHQLLLGYDGCHPGDYGNLDFIRQHDSSLTAVIQQFGLPDKPMIRRELITDIFRAAEIRAAFKVTDNPDYGFRIYASMKAAPYRYYLSRFDRLKAYQFLQQLGKYYSAEKIVHLLQMIESSGDYGYLQDIRLLFEELASEYRAGISKVKPKHLHDWLVERVNTQKVQGFELEIPEHVVRRLKLQLDNGRARFYLPHNAKELDQASQIFHNCVRTYKTQVKNQACNIVFMTDDDGSLTACLEVRSNTLVQAKLRYNRPVSEDSVINNAVIDWCRKAELQIGTSDVIEEKKAAV